MLRHDGYCFPRQGPLRFVWCKVHLEPWCCFVVYCVGDSPSVNVLKPSSYWRMSMFTMMWRWLIESRVLGGEGMRHELLRQTVFLWGGQAWVLWAKTSYNSLLLWFSTGIINDSEWWWSVLLTLTHPRADRRAECWLIVVGVADAREITGPRPDWPTAS